MVKPNYRKGRWFAPEFRADISNHNIKRTALPLDVRKKVRFSYNEKEELQGLANTIQGTLSEAVRIALYEWNRFSPSDVTPSKEKRDREVSVRLTAIEYLMVQDAAEEFGIKESEILRALPLALTRKIRLGKIRAFGGCHIQSQKERMKAWDAEYEKGNKPKNLATQAVKDKFYQRGLLMQEEWEQHKDHWEPIFDSYIKSNRAPESCWDDDGFTHKFNPQSFIFWYNNVEMAEHNGEADYQEALDLPKEEGVKMMFKVLCMWSLQDRPGGFGTEEEILKLAEDEWEENHTFRTDEELEALEALITIPIQEEVEGTPLEYEAPDLETLKEYILQESDTDVDLWVA